MDSEGRGKPEASELSEDLADAGLIRCLPDQTTQVRCVNLAVCTRRSLDLVLLSYSPFVGQDLA